MCVEDKVFNIILDMTGASRQEVEMCEELFLLGIDSLQKVDLILRLEECFQIEFDESDLDPEQLTTVTDVVVFVKGKLE